MIILGIDPGTATTGYGVIKQNPKRKEELEILDFGVITTKKGLSDASRLAVLAQDLTAIIKQFKPQRVGVERLFFTSNQKTAMTVSQARGVVLLLCQQKNIPIFEFTPLQVKSTLCGYGKADKQQVQLMVKQAFKLKSLPKPDDAADALAIALCAGLIKKS
jgi:crossover junction endodeoxyribonuclease RuvC